MSRVIRVFVNGKGVDVPEGATAIAAVRAWDPAAADAVERGAELLTDSRGLPAPADTALQAGAIFRLVPRRERGAVDDPDADATGDSGDDLTHS